MHAHKQTHSVFFDMVELSNPITRRTRFTSVFNIYGKSSYLYKLISLSCLQNATQSSPAANESRAQFRLGVRSLDFRQGQYRLKELRMLRRDCACAVSPKHAQFIYDVMTRRICPMVPFSLETSPYQLRDEKIPLLDREFTFLCQYKWTKSENCAKTMINTWV